MEQDCGCIKAFHLRLPLKCFEPITNIGLKMTCSKSLLQSGCVLGYMLTYRCRNRGRYFGKFSLNKIHNPVKIFLQRSANKKE